MTMTMPPDPLAGIGREMPPSFYCRPCESTADTPADAGGAERYAAALPSAALHAQLAAAIGDALSAPPVLHAAVVLPGLGRFDVHVADARDAVRLLLQCHTATGHAWFRAHRHTIERRLARRRDRLVVLTASEALGASSSAIVPNRPEGRGFKPRLFLR
jgi:hypothetical protein